MTHFTIIAPYQLRGTFAPVTYLPASPHCSNDWQWYRNINLLSIDYVFRPRLRPD